MTRTKAIAQLVINGLPLRLACAARINLADNISRSRWCGSLPHFKTDEVSTQKNCNFQQLQSSYNQIKTHFFNTNLLRVIRYIVYFEKIMKTHLIHAWFLLFSRVNFYKLKFYICTVGRGISKRCSKILTDNTRLKFVYV